MEWVIGNFVWIAAAGAAACVFLAVYVLRRERRNPPARPESRHGRP